MGCNLRAERSHCWNSLGRSRYRIVGMVAGRVADSLDHSPDSNPVAAVAGNTVLAVAGILGFAETGCRQAWHPQAPRFCSNCRFTSMQPSGAH